MWDVCWNYGENAAPRRYVLRAAQSEDEGDAPKGDKDWRQFTVVLMRALLPFPEAKQAVVDAFRRAGAEASP